MTVKSDAKFEEKLTLGSKNDMGNLVKFDVSSGKSGNLHFDMLLLLIAYKVSAWKVQENFEGKLTFSLKNDMRTLVNFNLSSGMSENLHFDGLLL